MEEPIRYPIQLEVSLWSQQSLLHAATLETKVDLLELHPVRAIALTVQFDVPTKIDSKSDVLSETILCIWDIYLTKLIKRVSLSYILGVLLSSTPGIKNPTLEPYSTHNIGNTRKMKKTYQKEYDSDLFDLRNELSLALGKTKTSESTSVNALTDSLGDIVRISFADNLPGLGQRISNSSQCAVALTFRGGIVFYDYISNQARIITSANDLSGKSILYSEFITDNLLAIGCNDGVIRILEYQYGKVIPSRGYFDSHSKGGEVVYLKNLLEGKYNETKINIFRFLSTGSDGNGYIWEGSFSGGTFIGCQAPLARLDDSNNKISIYGIPSSSSSSIISSNSNVFINSQDSSLYILGSDRVLRCWSLLPLDTSISGGLRQRSTVEQSIKLSCIARIKPGNNLPPNTAKFTTCSSIQGYPLFAGKTFVLTSSNGYVGITQAGDSSEDGLSMLPIYEIHLPSLISRSLLRSSTITKSTSKLSSAFIGTFAREHSSMRCYGAMTSLSMPGSIVMATSMGLLVVRLLKQSSIVGGHFIAQHPLWKGEVLSFGERVIVKLKYRLDESLVEGNPISTVISEELAFLPTGAMANGSNVTYDTSIQASLPLFTSPSVRRQSEVSFSSIQAYLSSLPASPQVINYRVPLTRPTFYVSPSGRYAAAVWENGNYLVIKVEIMEKQKGSLVEIERGLCSSFAWVGMDDTYMLISMPFAAQSASQVTDRKIEKRSSITTLFVGKKGDDSDRLPAKTFVQTKALVKRIVNDKAIHLIIDESANASSVASSFDVHRSRGCFGGLLVACNYLSLRNLSSKTESDLNASYVDGSASPDCCRLVAVYSSSSAPSSVNVVSIGPVMHSVDSVVWQYSTGLAVILTAFNATILRLSSSSSTGRCVLETLSTVSLPGMHPNFLTTFSWQPGCPGLLSISSTVYTGFIACQLSNRFVDSIAISEVNAGMSRRGFIRQAGYSEALLYYPNQLKGLHAILRADGQCLGSPVPVNRNPMAAVIYLLSSGSVAIPKACKWLAAFPNSQHDSLASLLLKRGLVREACSLPGATRKTFVLALRVLESQTMGYGDAALASSLRDFLSRASA